MDWSEALAQHVVEHATPGTEMRDVSTQAHGQVDFELFQGAQLIGRVEVTRAMDDGVRGTNAAIEKHGEDPFPAPSLKHSWWLHSGVGAHIVRIRRGVEPYLKAAEDSGRCSPFAPFDTPIKPHG